MDNPITREEYEKALHTIRMYAIQCNHLVSTIDLMMGDIKTIELPKKIDNKLSKQKVFESVLSVRAKNFLLNYYDYKFSSKSTVQELSNISFNGMCITRGVGKKTVDEIIDLCNQAGVDLKP